MPSPLASPPASLRQQQRARVRNKGLHDGAPIGSFADLYDAVVVPSRKANVPPASVAAVKELDADVVPMGDIAEEDDDDDGEEDSRGVQPKQPKQRPTASILPAHRVHLTPSDTLASTWLSPPIHARVKSILVAFRNGKITAFAVAWLVPTSSAIVGTALAGAAPPEVMWLFTATASLLAVAFLVCVVSFKVLWRLLRQSQYVQIRAAVSMLTSVLLGVALSSDANLALMCVPLFLLHLGSFASDSFVYAWFRPLVVACALGPTVVAFALVAEGLVPAAVNVVLPIGTGFSLYQVARDLLFSSSVLLVAEVAFLLRGRHQRRLLHLGVEIKREVVDTYRRSGAGRRRRGRRSRWWCCRRRGTLQRALANTWRKMPFPATSFAGAESVAGEDRPRLGRRQQSNVNASSVVVQSGFLVANERPELPGEAGDDDDVALQGERELEAVPENKAAAVAAEPPPPVAKQRIYVMKLAVNRSDALAMHLLGRDDGKVVMDAIRSRVGRLVYGVAFVPPTLLAVCLPFSAVPHEVYWIVLPCILVVAFRDFGASSRIALRLLVRRVELHLSLAFLLVWTALTCLAFGPDPRVMLAVFAATSKWGELTSDAIVAERPQTKVLRVLGALTKSTVLFAIMTGLFLTANVARTDAVLWSVAPVTNASAPLDSNAVTVIDLQQVAADLGINWTIHGIVRAVWAWLHDDGVMEFVRAPLAPQFGDSGASSGVGEARDAHANGVVASPGVGAVPVGGPGLSGPGASGDQGGGGAAATTSYTTTTTRAGATSASAGGGAKAEEGGERDDGHVQSIVDLLEGALGAENVEVITPDSS